jgi:carbonic anhydrase/acetyltransferase-like protein (isoleucine patch superfamily)
MAIYAYGERIPQIDPTVWIFPSADIIGDVCIGKGAYIGAGAIIRGDYGTIIIEDGVAIEENVTIHASPGGICVIKRNAIIGHMAMLHKCTIHENAVIGMNAIVSNDADVGEAAIVAEGAVVKQGFQIPAHQIAVGVPAKVIGPVPDDVAKLWIESGKIYRQLAIDYPKKLKKLDHGP